jgi:hypothetical protein
MATRPKVGDVFEIKSSIGYAYAQMTHRHSNYGPLIRVFDKVFDKRPKDFDKVRQLPVRFSTFYPLGTALNRGVNEVVARLEVRHDLQPFPIFRAAGFFTDPKEKVSVWFLWFGDDNAELERVECLSPVQRKYPILESWNDSALIDAIESNWRPETDPR